MLLRGLLGGVPFRHVRVMARLREVSLSEIKASGYKAGAHIFRMVFGDRDSVAEPGLPLGTSGNWWTVFALSLDTFDHVSGLFAYYQSPERKLGPHDDASPAYSG